MCPPDGDWQLQVPPGAPGTARQGPTRNIIVFTNDGGIATQPKAPGADVPPATTAGAPGQYCLCAAHQAPGHERPFTASTGAAKHGRPRAAPRAPGADVPLATPAGAPGQYCLCAVAIATVALPAGSHRLRQEGLPHTPANPRTLTYSCSYRIVSSLQCKPQSSSRPAADHGADSPSLAGKGPGVRSKPHQAHPAIQVPPRSRSCSTARTGFPLNHPSRAPPPRHCGRSHNPASNPLPVAARPPLPCREGAGG